MPEAKVVLITGASSGFGKAFAAELARRGHRVYGTSRNASFPHASVSFPAMVPMDVRDERSVGEAVRFVLDREQGIEVLINNAGIGLSGAIEDTTPAEALNLFETNLFGVHRVCRAVLPAMRARGRGLVANVGSIGGEIAVPFHAFYSASKASLAALTEVMRIELAPFGIHVTLIAPSGFHTEMPEHRQFVAAVSAGSPFAERCRRAASVMTQDEVKGGDPEALARLVARVVESGRPRPRYYAGAALPRLGLYVKRLAPAAFSQRLLRNHYGV